MMEKSLKSMKRKPELMKKEPRGSAPTAGAAPHTVTQRTATVGSPFNLVPHALRIHALLEKMEKEKGGTKGALEREYREQNVIPRLGRTFRDCLEEREVGKITQPGCLVYDRTRFKLTNCITNFINASALTSWDRRENAYILTQIPNHQTQVEFWQMVWQTKASTIAVLLPSAAFPAWKADFWWPLEALEFKTYGGRFKIVNEEVVEGLEWRSYFLKVEGLTANTQGNRTVRILNYEAWKSDPEPPVGLPRFLGRLRLFLASGNRKNAVPASPLVFVCPTGVQRCGLVTALDMAMQQLFATYKIDLPAVVKKVRWERYGTLSKGWEYLWLHKRVCEVCLTTDVFPQKERLELGPRLVQFTAEMEPEDPISYGGPLMTPTY